MSFRPRWYGADVLGNGTGRKWPELQNRGAVQDNGFRVRSLPIELLKIAGEEYEAQGFSQTSEKLQQRGGFSQMELVLLLADAVERYKDAARYYQSRAASPSKGDAPG